MSENLSQNPSPIKRLRPSIFYILVLCVAFGDQLTKSAISRRLSLGESIPVLGDAFRFTLAHNTGGAWGLLPSGNRIFVGIAILAVLCIVLAYHRMKQMEMLMAGAFALALGGALGNLMDRLRFGYVVDFLHAKIINFPIFNVADSAISIGICLLFLHFIHSVREESAAERKKQAAQQEVQG
jgi:signal peptidase II